MSETSRQNKLEYSVDVVCDFIGYVVHCIYMESEYGTGGMHYSVSIFGRMYEMCVCREKISAMNIAFFPLFRSHITVKSNTSE